MCECLDYAEGDGYVCEVCLPMLREIAKRSSAGLNFKAMQSALEETFDLHPDMHPNAPKEWKLIAGLLIRAYMRRVRTKTPKF